MKKVRLFLLLGFCANMPEYALAMAENPSAPAPKTVVVGPESTVYGIAYEYGIPTQALIQANGIPYPYVLQMGQVLIIPSPHEHIIGQGETLKSVADNYGVKVDVLAQENATQTVRPGERLVIPSRDTDSVAEALRPPADNNISTSSLAPLPTVSPSGNKPPLPSHASRASSSLPNEFAEEIAQEKGIRYEGKKEDSSPARPKMDSSSPQPMLIGNLAQGNAGAPLGSPALYQEEEKLEKPKKEIKKVTKTKEETEEKKEKPKKEEKAKEKEPVSQKEEGQTKPKDPAFIWPVQGTVITKFNPGKNDGIKIKVGEGTSVKAAAAGDVLYAGSELKGFGNLILLKHKGGWVTAYAYNSTLLVKKGDGVKQGQVIAKSGKTGDAKEPQLHFEVRKGKQPVDPLTQLGS
jgi:murein DD-endopeptidase MepM/ murein hydrolase activator NlpD